VSSTAAVERATAFLDSYEQVVDSPKLAQSDDLREQAKFEPGSLNKIRSTVAMARRYMVGY
jgi:hypothetical protein